jgi:hypothetical protein
MLRADESTWKVGLAQAKITPQEAIWMAGYAARNRPAEGTIHELWVKVLAIEDTEGNRGVVVTSDVLGFPREVSEGICGALKQQYGLERSQIMLASSHTHSGPVVGTSLTDCYPLDDAQIRSIERYTVWLEETIVKTIATALSRSTPATLWAAEGMTDFAVNRRNNRAADVDRLREQGQPLKGPVDHRVPVLAVRTPEGGLEAAVFGYACHNTTLSDYEWCGDYSGFAQIALETKYPGAAAMFQSGCGADQNPLPRRSVELCAKYGQMLADAVSQVLEGPMRPLDARLGTAFEAIKLEYGQQPTRADLESLASGTGYQARWAKRLLAQLDAGGTFDTAYNAYPVQVWQLGGTQRWIVLGGEVVVDYPLMFKERYGPECWVTGYANDVMAYIPSRRVWEEGGYEAGAFRVYGLPADRWTPDIQDRIAACVEKLVDKLNVKEPVAADN